MLGRALRHVALLHLVEQQLVALAWLGLGLGLGLRLGLGLGLRLGLGVGLGLGLELVVLAAHELARELLHLVGAGVWG